MKTGERGTHRCGKALLDIKEWFCNLLGISTSSSPHNLLLLTFSFSYSLEWDQISQVKGTVFHTSIRYQSQAPESSLLISWLQISGFPLLPQV